MAVDPSRAEAIQRRLAECRELEQQFWDSKGVEMYRSAQAGQIAGYSFEVNFQQLITIVSAHFHLADKGKLRDWHEREPLHQYLFEASRRLQNFLASASALVAQTACFVKRSYRGRSNVLKEYEQGRRERLDSKPVIAFTSKLRNLFLHETIPFLQSVRGGSEATGRDRFRLELDLQKVNVQSWSAAAGEYIATHGTKIDLQLYLIEHYEAVRQFYGWFDERNEEWSHPEWAKSLALHGAALNSRAHIYDFDL